ncbi:ochratoxin A non-ribosomal peptide synthetase [Coccidioides immitis RMSCC 2394]|uniref:Ochratoxin A non-ribosomal peptide synthetase n=1 Tax=Coccidioides immitis RMSCC 2394 TaxID=404692 RepID=A0A0J7B575_COCIT|nr:ochratoxin A non-ribosomal peptide synthetase [Coccidioides immitis RMSCC 2394]
MDEASITDMMPRTVYELIEQLAVNEPDLPLIAYPSDKNTNDFVHYTAQDLNGYSSQVAEHYAEFIHPRRNSSDRTRVVALLAPSTVDYLISTLALCKLGFTVLFLSTRLADADFVGLLNETSCSDVILDKIFHERISNLRERVSGLQTHIIADWNIYLTPSRNNPIDQELDLNVETNNACWIIHSSGSTGPPKPVPQKHSAILRNAADNFGMTAFITLPLFHAHGISSVIRGFTSRKEVFLYSASLPLTGARLVETFESYQFEMFSGVPYALKLIAETPQGTELLSRIKLVTFGGSSCPEALGDELVRRGVRLACHYGCTECGQLMTSVRPPDDKDWNYMRISSRAAPFLHFEEQDSSRLYELVVLPGWPAKVAQNRSDGSYATKDLFIKHPTKPDRWKLVGRLDDTLVLLNGEKAIPLQMEQLVRMNPYVVDAVVFGSGKPMLGMLVIASENARELETEAFLDIIEKDVAKANTLLPAYARIDRDMIRVLPFGTEYPKTDKGTVIRAAFYARFADIIEQTYDAAAADSSKEAREMALSELEEFLRKTFIEVLGLSDQEVGQLQNDTDLFALGVDSLQALRARAQIVKIATRGRLIGQNVVFEHPSIGALAKYLSSTGSNNNFNEKERRQDAENMKRLVETYSSFASHVSVETPAERTLDGRVIIVTGATGSLGAHVVSQLIKRADIIRVHCLVRASSIDQAHSRVVSSLQQRKLCDSISPFELRKISAQGSSFSEENLGLNEQTYQCMLREVDTVIHLAWAVNFNLGLSSLESQIRGTHNLIKFCLSTHSLKPARFYFASSIAAVINTPGPARIPEKIPDTTCDSIFHNAQFSGYGQSKLVAELICARAAKLGMVCRVFRLGQIIGDTEHGIWNPQEAIPLIIRSAITIGALPELNEQLSWLPVDTAASAILDLTFPQDRDVDMDPGALLHIIHPTTVDWSRDLLPALHAAGLEFEQLPPSEWVKRLRANQDPVANPPIKLIGFFEAKYGSDNKEIEQLYFCTDLASYLSPTLHSARPLSHSLVAKIVRHWRIECWNDTNSDLRG